MRVAAVAAALAAVTHSLAAVTQALAAVAIALSAVSLPGCVQTTVVRDGWADFASDAAAHGANVTLGRDPADGGDRRRASERPHRLRLAIFEGPGRVADGQEAAVLARRVEGLQDVTLVNADGVAILYAGRFARVRDRAAKRALKEARKLEGADRSVFEGQRPFRDAELVLIAGPGSRENAYAPADPLDLRGHPGFYTLQVGFFDQEAKPDRRTAAEFWANQLRREEGVEAFYHHGPNRSLVTVGLFHQSDFVREGQLDAYPPEARALQKRFPHNLGNGSTVIERRRGGGDGTEQASLLVKTPG